MNNRLISAALAAIAATSGIPLALAQLDLAGVISVFGISNADHRGLAVLAGIGGFMTLAVVALAVSGAVLAAVGSEHAHPVLIVSAVAGFATALMLWLPMAIALAVAAHLTERNVDTDRPIAV